jgi:hypothetical protein
MKKLEQILEAGPNNEVEEPADPSSSSSSPTSSQTEYGMLTLDMARLRPLATRLTLVSCAPHRPDWISWVGGSLYAAAWNKYDEDETPIPWIFPKAEDTKIQQ